MIQGDSRLGAPTRGGRKANRRRSFTISPPRHMRKNVADLSLYNIRSGKRAWSDPESLLGILLLLLEF